jgi:hypothetical protein
LAGRCDNPECSFHRKDLVWNGNALPLILDHSNGNSRDNRVENLRLLCPNCDSQLQTRGGLNKGRIQHLSEGGFEVHHRDGRRDAIVAAKGVSLSVSVWPASVATTPSAQPPVAVAGDKRGPAERIETPPKRGLCSSVDVCTSPSAVLLSSARGTDPGRLGTSREARCGRCADPCHGAPGNRAAPARWAHYRLLRKAPSKPSSRGTRDTLPSAIGFARNLNGGYEKSLARSGRISEISADPWC